VTPCRLVDLVDRAARNVAGIVDEDVDVGGILRKSRQILRLAQVNDMGGGVDLMYRSQTLGERLQLIAAAGGKAEMTAFLGKGLGGGRANALGGAGDQDALSAQMEIHGGALLIGGSWGNFDC
jgi:hypothetical protein